jgi:predicted MFS family arabinose efflux permease
MERVRPEDHAVTNSFLMLAWTSAWTISAAAGGLLIERHGFTSSFVAAVALYFASTALYFAFFGREDRTPPARKKEGGGV